MDGSWLTPRANHVCTWLSHTTLESQKKSPPKLILNIFMAPPGVLKNSPLAMGFFRKVDFPSGIENLSSVKNSSLCSFH